MAPARSAANTLAEALRADMAATGETRPQYAARRGIPIHTLHSLLGKAPTSTMAQLLAQEISARLAAIR
jgi:hypothetical protein